MTPQEKDLIANVARKLKDSPNKPKDAEAEQFINSEIASQPDIVYKLTQAVLVQEMALKELKQKNDYLQESTDYYRDESQRGSLSKMFGGSRPAPVPPQPVSRPSAFGGFMQTAAGVAAGMVAGNLISNMLFDHDTPAAETAAAPAADAATETAATDTAAPAADPSSAATETAAADTGSDSGFLSGDSGFSSDYTDPGFGGDNGFGSDSGFGGDDMFANNDNTDSGFFGGDSGDSGFFGGSDDFGGDDF